jgi:hypothetical protein
MKAGSAPIRKENDVSNLSFKSPAEPKPSGPTGGLSPAQSRTEKFREAFC